MEQNNEIITELKEIAPELSRLRKPTKGEIPVAYFQSFPFELINTIRAQEVAEELAEVAPALAGIEKQNILSPPSANYFHDSPTLIWEKIREENKAAVSATPGWFTSVNVYVERITGLIFRPRYAAIFAGFASIFLIAVMLVLKMEEHCADLDCRMAQISNEELNAYFSTHADEFSSDLLDYPENGFQQQETFNKLIHDLTDDEFEKAILY